jgi:hypothetical protein
MRIIEPGLLISYWEAKGFRSDPSDIFPGYSHHPSDFIANIHLQLYTDQRVIIVFHISFKITKQGLFTEEGGRQGASYNSIVTEYRIDGRGYFVLPAESKSAFSTA